MSAFQSIWGENRNLIRSANLRPAWMRRDRPSLLKKSGAFTIPALTVRVFGEVFNPIRAGLVQVRQAERVSKGNSPARVVKIWFDQSGPNCFPSTFGPWKQDMSKERPGVYLLQPTPGSANRQLNYSAQIRWPREGKVAGLAYLQASSLCRLQCADAVRRPASYSALVSRSAWNLGSST